MNVIAIDVGSAGVRAAIVAFDGHDHKKARILASHEKDIRYYQDGEKFEQSSDEIWMAVCECTRVCLQNAKYTCIYIVVIGFSATCSLVIQRTTDGGNPRNVIMWMDHRAIEEAKFVTESKSPVLEQLGGVCSPEFSLSKILWLKKNVPHDVFNNDTSLFELPDWLAWRCIAGNPNDCPRSLCCLTCKWGYDTKRNCNCDIIKQSLGDEICSDKFSQAVLKPGTIAGYLSVQAAEELGITLMHSRIVDPIDLIDPKLRIVVGTSLIDAHSGMLAMLSAKPKELNIEDTFCSLAGTSSCHMLLSQKRNYYHGIWGPYKDVVLDDYYLLESGQTLTGKLLEICIERTEEGKTMLNAGKSMKDIIQSLNKQLETMGPKSTLFTLPSFHGNRSPLANPRLMGGIYGLTARRESNLLDHYISSVEAIVFEVKLIVETLKTGHLGNILVSGGLMKNKFYMQTLADVLQCKAIRMSLQDVDFMVMGGALIARCAVINNKTIGQYYGHSRVRNQPLNEQNIEGIQYEQLDMQVYNPTTDPCRIDYLEKKYACYREFVTFSQRVDKILHN